MVEERHLHQQQPWEVHSNERLVSTRTYANPFRLAQVQRRALSHYLDDACFDCPHYVDNDVDFHYDAGYALLTPMQVMREASPILILDTNFVTKIGFFVDASGNNGRMEEIDRELVRNKKFMFTREQMTVQMNERRTRLFNSGVLVEEEN